MGSTAFAGTKIPLLLTFYTILHFANSNGGIDQNFVSRHIGISPKGAFDFLKRIRLHLASLEFDRRVGGNGRAVHINLSSIRSVHRPGERRKSANLILLSDQESLTARVIGRPRRHILKKVIDAACHPNSRLVTDCYETWHVSSEFSSRTPIIDFSEKYEFVDQSEYISNSGFQLYFSRTLANDHRRVNVENLWLYLSEAIFRFNRRFRSENLFPDMICDFKPLSPETRVAIERRFSLISERGKGQVVA